VRYGSLVELTAAIADDARRARELFASALR